MINRHANGNKLRFRVEQMFPMGRQKGQAEALGAVCGRPSQVHLVVHEKCCSEAQRARNTNKWPLLARSAKCLQAALCPTLSSGHNSAQCCRCAVCVSVTLNAWVFLPFCLFTFLSKTISNKAVRPPKARG